MKYLPMDVKFQSTLFKILKNLPEGGHGLYIGRSVSPPELCLKNTVSLARWLIVSGH